MRMTSVCACTGAVTRVHRLGGIPLDRIRARRETITKADRRSSTELARRVRKKVHWVTFDGEATLSRPSMASSSAGASSHRTGAHRRAGDEARSIAVSLWQRRRSNRRQHEVIASGSTPQVARSNSQVVAVYDLFDQARRASCRRTELPPITGIGSSSKTAAARLATCRAVQQRFDERLSWPRRRGGHGPPCGRQWHGRDRGSNRQPNRRSKGVPADPARGPDTTRPPAREVPGGAADGPVLSLGGLPRATPTAGSPTAPSTTSAVAAARRASVATSRTVPSAGAHRATVRSSVSR
jgi:hypothetical protein